jgi:hypothetical protein
MLDSFNIKITKLVKLPQEIIELYPEEYGDAVDVVTVVHFVYEATKGGISSTKESFIHTPFVKDSNFIAYADLKQEDILTWLTTLIGEEELNKIKDDLEQDIDNRTPPKLPWE